jgi:hypothetical protein
MFCIVDGFRDGVLESGGLSKLNGIFMLESALPILNARVLVHKA